MFDIFHESNQFSFPTDNKMSSLRLPQASSDPNSNSNSNSNWTFIALNLPKQEDSKAQQTKSSQQNSVSRDITGVEHHGERQEDDSG